MCEALNCPPSQILEKYPNITPLDIDFMKGVGTRKMTKQAELTAEVISRMFKK